MSAVPTLDREKELVVVEDAKSAAEEARTVGAPSEPATTPDRRRVQLDVSRPFLIAIGVGVTVILAGFALLAVAWGQVAGEPQVYRQIPYVMSGGFVGLGLVMVGAVGISVVIRFRDSDDKDRALAQVLVAVEELKAAMEAEAPR